MNEWAVSDFVSRVAERVSTAGEGLAAQIIDRHLTNEFDADIDGSLALALAFPFVEPHPDFVRQLRESLLDAPPRISTNTGWSLVNDRRVVYGVAAVGSIASAAVVAMFFFRSRAAHRSVA